MLAVPESMDFFFVCFTPVLIEIFFLTSCCSFSAFKIICKFSITGYLII